MVKIHSFGYMGSVLIESSLDLDSQRISHLCITLLARYPFHAAGCKSHACASWCRYCLKLAINFLIGIVVQEQHPSFMSFLPNPVQSVNDAVAMVYQRCAAVTVILSSWSHQPCPCVVGPSSTTTLISNLSAAGNIAQIRDLPAAYQTSSTNRLSRLQQANLRNL